MGLDISKITNAELKKLAYLHDRDNNSHLDADEFTIFKSESVSMPGVSTEDFVQAMGLYKSTSATTTEATPAAPTEPTKKEKKAAKKALKEKQDNVKLDIEGLIYGKKEARLNQDPSISLNNLINKLTTVNPADHATVIAEVQDVVTFVQSTKFNSKKEVEALKVKIETAKDPEGKPLFNDFQKDLAKYMVELAKREQIEKEVKELKVIYDEISKDNSQPNYSKYLESVMTEIENRGVKDTSYYSDEALDTLETIITKDAMHTADQRRVKMINEGSDNTSGKEVKKELLSAGDTSDKIYRKAVKKDKGTNELVGRWLDRDRRAEELKSITEKELKNELGEELFNLLRVFINNNRNEDGTYNVSELSELISKRVGYNVSVDTSDDRQMSEIQGIINELTGPTRRNLLDKDVKKLLKLTHIPETPKDRNVLRAVSESLIPAISGLFAGGATYQSLDLTNKVFVEITGATADSIGNIPGAVIKKGIDGKITIEITQKVLQDQRALMALAGAGIGVLTSVAMKLIFGMENNETSCLSIADFDLTDEKYTNAEKYKEYIKTTQSEAKANIIIGLVEVYQEQYGNDWARHYDSALKKMAGTGSPLNCDELRGGSLVTTTGVEETEPETETKNTTITQGKKDAVDPKKVKVELKEENYINSSWEKLSSQYECLDEILDTIPDAKTKYPNCYKKKGVLAEKLLKAAQAVNDQRVFNDLEKMLYLAEEAFKSPDYKYESLKNCEFIDHATFCAIMKADWLGNVRMPDSLAGCQRRIKDTKDNKYNPNANAQNAPVAPAEVYTMTGGEKAKFGYRVNGGPIIHCKDASDLDKQVAQAQKDAQAKGENVTIEKIKPWSEFEK